MRCHRVGNEPDDGWEHLRARRGNEAGGLGGAPRLDLNYAGFLYRLVAFVIDQFLLGAASWLVGVLLGGGLAVSTSVDEPDALGDMFMVIGICLSWGWFALFESSPWQATPGKRVMGLAVTDLEGRRIGFGRASGRYFAKFLSGILLLAGYLMAAFTKRRQALHDMLAGTLVLRRP